MTIELAKLKERDVLQTNEVTDLRQSNAFFERVRSANGGRIEL